MRRVLFGIFWFGIFWVALTIIGGGITGSTFGAKGPQAGEVLREGRRPHGYPGADIGSAEFSDRFGTHVLIAAAALAALGTVAGKLPGTRPER